MPISPRLRQSLEALVSITLEIIEQGRATGRFASSTQAYFGWRLQGEPRYSDRGVELPPARGETTVRPSWFVAIAAVAQQEVPQTEAFKAALAELQRAPEVGNYAEQYLQCLVSAVSASAFEKDPRPPREAFDGLVTRFLEDIQGKPFKCGAEIELDGIALESQSVQLAPGIALRRPVREDYERETPDFGLGPPFRSPFLSRMSAIATITREGGGTRDVQRAVEKLLPMLRLFRVASVTYLSYRLFSESLVKFMGGQIVNTVQTVVQERAVIGSSDEPQAQQFWQALEPIIPDTFYEVSASKWDHRDVAYERYSAALANRGSFEERVASAVMALEALFLQERQELGYRLGLRAAKLLSFLQERPVAVRDVLREAYTVRSTFAHGARLSSSERSKLESRYQNAGGLVRYVLDFVRKSILAFLIVPREKRELISLLDDAFIDRSVNEELHQLLLPVLPFV